jgi:transcriptional regulator with XRE-family HTH domain
MPVGKRIRELRKLRKLAQADIQRQTGMLSCYTSQVENGVTVPNLKTFEKYAMGFEVRLYRLVYEREEPPQEVNLPFAKNDTPMRRERGSEWEDQGKFAAAFSRMALRKVARRA